MAKKASKKNAKKKSTKRVTKKTSKSSRTGKPNHKNNGGSKKINGATGKRDICGDEKRIGQIVLWMTKGYLYASLPSMCAEYLKIDEGHSEKLINEARTRITRASYTNRDLELGTAINRCNQLFIDCRSDDKRTALLAQKELHKLLKLYDLPIGSEFGEGVEGSSDEQGQLDSIAEHLLPLGLAPETYPLSEHARIAAEYIVSHGGGK